MLGFPLRRPLHAKTEKRPHPKGIGLSRIIDYLSLYFGISIATKQGNIKTAIKKRATKASCMAVISTFKGTEFIYPPNIGRISLSAHPPKAPLPTTFVLPPPLMLSFSAQSHRPRNHNLLPPQPPQHRLEQNIKHRNKEQIQHSRHQHSTHHRRPDRMPP